MNSLWTDRGGVQMAIYSDDPSSNPVEAYCFSIKFPAGKRTKIIKKRPIYLPMIMNLYVLGKYEQLFSNKYARVFLGRYNNFLLINNLA